MSLDLVGDNTTHILRVTQNKSQTNSASGTLRHTQQGGENCVIDIAGKALMTIGNEIRRRRKALGMTLEELALQVDGDNGNLSRLERGKQGYSDEMLRKIAQALGCSVADLFAGAEGAANVSPTPLGTRRIPLVSYVQAGHMTECVDSYAVGDACEWLLTDLELSGNAFALRIKGDSMLPEFREGDSGINDRGEQVFELVPLNDDYPSMRSDLSHIQIIGTMVEHRRYRKR